MRFNHLIQILLITCMLSLLSGCGTEPTAEQANATPPYHNPYFAEFILAITDTSRMVQPIPVTVPVDIAAARPGKQLFMSPELSVNNTISCATCHIITQGGDDNRPVSTGIFGRKGELNAPTVLNSGFNIAQFWDGRAATLEEQALGPLVMPNEMGMESPQAVADKLNANAKWRQLFIETFGEPATPEGIAFALAEFQRTLITPNSRFDRYLQGDKMPSPRSKKKVGRHFSIWAASAATRVLTWAAACFKKPEFSKPLMRNTPTSGWGVLISPVIQLINSSSKCPGCAMLQKPPPTFMTAAFPL